MVLVQKWPFFQFFCFSNIAQENVFYNILERKNAFLGYKNNKFKKSNNWDFSKGVDPYFWSKNGHFSTFFFRQYRPGRCVLRHSTLKKRLSSYKNIKFKKSKNWDFSNGVNPWFWSKKWPFFQLLFLGNIGQENVFYDILERKNAFLRYKNNKFKKSKNWDFSKGVNQCFWSKNGHFCNYFF